MLFIDDLAVVRVLQRLGAVLLADLVTNLLDQPLFDAAVAENVIRRDAGLAAVKEFSEDDPLGGQLQIGGGIHDTGAFAAQLQHRGGQVFSRMAQHFPAHALAAGEEDHVEFLLQQSGIFISATGDHGHIFRLKALRDDLRHHGGGGR